MVWDTQFTSFYSNLNFAKTFVPYFSEKCQMITIEVSLKEDKLLELVNDLMRRRKPI